MSILGFLEILHFCYLCLLMPSDPLGAEFQLVSSDPLGVEFLLLPSDPLGAKLLWVPSTSFCEAFICHVICV